MHKIVFYLSLIILSRLYSLYKSLLTSAIWRTRGVKIGADVSIRVDQFGHILLHRGVTVAKGCVIVATSEKSHARREKSILVVEEGTAINEYCNIRASGGEIYIGRKCLIAQMVSIIASNHAMAVGEYMIDQLWAPEPYRVSIGQDVWIGAGVTVLPGSKIGDGAVIAAGAVVVGEVPPNEIWGGVPARKIRDR